MLLNSCLYLFLFDFFNSFLNANENITNTILLFLTKPLLNLFFIAVIFFCYYKIFINKDYSLIFSLFIQKINISSNLNVPLSNTLFLFHPIFFFKFWVYILFYLINNRMKSINIFSSVFIFFILFLGGYWSLQEFNWGGWWNWDILEIFSLLLTINLTVFFHLKRTSKIKVYNYCTVLCSLLIFYYFINKTGFNSSIHSFVKSSTLSNNIHTLNLIVVIVLFNQLKNKSLLILFISVLIVFLFFKNFFFIKFILFFYFIIYFFFKKKKFKKINDFLHKIYLILLINLIIFNYFNCSFLFFSNLNFFKNHSYINWNKFLIQSFTGYTHTNFCYSDYFLFKLNNVLQKNFFIFFLKKLFYSKINGFIFF